MVKTYKYLSVLLSFLVTLLVGWMVVFKTSSVLTYGAFTSVFGYFLIFIMVTPAGAIVLGERSQRLTYFEWLGRVVCANLILIIISIAAAFAFLSKGPELAQGALSYSFTKEVVTKYSFTHWGIFPWGIYGVWGMLIAYFAYIKKGTPFLYQSGDFLSRRLQAFFKAFIEIVCFSSTIFLLSFIAVSVVLLLSYAVYEQFHFSHFMLPHLTVSLLSFLLAFFTLRWGRRVFVRFAQKNFGMQKVITLFFIIMFPLLLLVAVLNGYAVSIAPELYERAKCIVCTNYLNSVPVEDRFATLYWGWFLLWAPLAGSYLAYISKGRTLREFIMGVMFMPFVIITTFVLLREETAEHIRSLVNRPDLQSILYVTLAFLNIWFLMLIVHNARDNKLLISGVFPVSDKFKRDRTKVCNASKVVGISKFGRNLMITMILVVMLHSMIGWYIMQFQIAGFGVLIIQAMYFAGCFFLVQSFLDKIWLGNKNISPFKSAYVDLPKLKSKQRK